MSINQIPPLRNPIAPPERSAERSGLTGKTRYRLGWRGRLVLQVEYRACRPGNMYTITPPYLVRYWRDATVEDLQALYQDDREIDPDGHRRGSAMLPVTRTSSPRTSS
ncbi:MAG: hypothetical protein KUL86_10745 [Castellaniella sp.]|nr:hypothetical protein [Castellaniella sp.]